MSVFLLCVSVIALQKDFAGHDELAVLRNTQGIFVVTKSKGNRA